jgi:hypothetical protein
VKTFTDTCYRWLEGKPVKLEFHARVASLMASVMQADNLDVDQAYQYWCNKRPDFFEDV